MTCDDFLKILVEQGGGRDPATKAAFEEHARTCEDCKLLVPAYSHYEQAMKEPKKTPPAQDPVKERVMASARDHIARKKLAETVAELTKKPWHALLWPLGLVALLVVAFAGGVTVGAGSSKGQPPPPFKPRGDEGVELEGPPGLHLKAAKALKALGDESWRRHAQAVIDDKSAGRPQVDEAKRLLGK